MITKKNQSKQDKVNIIKGMINELKKVNWPSKKELIIYSFLVIFIIIIFSIIIYSYDLILAKSMSFVIKKNK